MASLISNMCIDVLFEVQAIICIVGWNTHRNWACSEMYAVGLMLSKCCKLVKSVVLFEISPFFVKI